MSEITKYCAVFEDDNADGVGWVGSGDSPDDAYLDLIMNELDDYCSYTLIDQFQKIEVYIYTRISVEDSDFEEDELNPDWEWLLDEKLETRIVSLSEYNENRNT